MMNGIIGNRFQTHLGMIAFTTAILIGFAGCGRFYFGSISAAMQYARGDRLLIDEPVQSLGNVPVGSRQTIEYILTNRTAKAIKFLGSRTSCTCAMVGELPSGLDPSATLMIQVAFAAPLQEDKIAGTVDIYTDDPRHQSLGLDFVGHAVASPGSIQAF